MRSDVLVRHKSSILLWNMRCLLNCMQLFTVQNGRINSIPQFARTPYLHRRISPRKNPKMPVHLYTLPRPNTAPSTNRSEENVTSNTVVVWTKNSSLQFSGFPPNVMPSFFFRLEPYGSYFNWKRSRQTDFKKSRTNHRITSRCKKK